MQAVVLIKYLQDKGIDMRILNNIRIDFLSKIPSENSSMDSDDFVTLFRTISKIKDAEMEEKLMNFCEDKRNNTVKYTKYSEFVDFYQYLPLHIKKDRNLSQELYYVLTSNKFSNAGEKIETDQEQMGLKQSLDFLWMKIEERFNKVAQAFRFFDINNNGVLSLKEFEIGVHKLSTRFTRDQIRKMFNYIDTNNDNCIQYVEFWELCDECRRGIDPYRIDKKLKRGDAVSKSKPKSLNDSGTFRVIKDDDDIISSSLASFKKKHKYSTLLPSEVNQNFAYGIKTPAPENIHSVLTYEPLNDYIMQSKIREEKIISKKKIQNIFRRAKGTYSSEIRDKELNNQRLERNEKFIAQHLGYLKMKQLEKDKAEKLKIQQEFGPQFGKIIPKRNKSVSKPTSDILQLIEAKKKEMIKQKHLNQTAIDPKELYKVGK